jgi:hypothetical protein
MPDTINPLIAAKPACAESKLRSPATPFSIAGSIASQLLPDLPRKRP